VSVGELTPFFVFWVLMYLGREELGLKGVIISTLIWLGILLGYSSFRPTYVFIIAQAVLDIVLAFIIFGGSINNRVR
jgi:hypothetical protein